MFPLSGCRLQEECARALKGESEAREWLARAVGGEKEAREGLGKALRGERQAREELAASIRSQRDLSGWRYAAEQSGKAEARLAAARGDAEGLAEACRGLRALAQAAGEEAAARGREEGRRALEAAEARADATEATFKQFRREAEGAKNKSGRRAQVRCRAPRIPGVGFVGVDHSA